MARIVKFRQEETMTATTPKTERVTATLRWYTPCPQPNGMQAVPEGIWVIDQQDLKVYLLDWQDGHTLESFPTETNHSSGITWDGEHLWVASTFPPIEIFAFTRDGREVRRLATPGANEKSGAHGLEWIDGKLWVTVPPSATTYQLDPSDGRVLKQFAAPGNRPHGIAWDGQLLWVSETTKRSITGYTLDGEARRVLEMEAGPAEGPDPHGMTYKDGELWYCDAATRAVCTIPVPA
jgi:outer membrane protein assembly factor BamB